MENEKRLIDANALVKWLEECTDEKDWLVSQYNADWIWSMIDSAPTVDAVEVVHGKWERESVPIKNMDIVRYRDTCSICGAKAEFLCRDSHYNYCHNCGAKMDGGNEDV